MCSFPSIATITIIPYNPPHTLPCTTATPTTPSLSPQSRSSGSTLAYHMLKSLGIAALSHCSVSRAFSIESPQWMACTWAISLTIELTPLIVLLCLNCENLGDI